MRKVININDNWTFIKEGKAAQVNLPHTWNAKDGQAGGFYYRGKCLYVKELPAARGITYIEFNGANSVTEVYVNGKKAGEHCGGYSVFRFDLTAYLDQPVNKLEVYVDNSEDAYVYPAMADFTFYGGLYRDVNLIEVGRTHFDLEDKSMYGIKATPSLEVGWKLNVKSSVVNPDGAELVYNLFDADKKVAASARTDAASNEITFDIDNPRLWNGVEDPYLYTLACALCKDGEITDNVEFKVGFRHFSFDGRKGFELNGKPLKLKGVSRHQDRKGKGNALSFSDHLEDIETILDIGANSVRLAHYQHSRDFYDLCDEKGLLVWAEVPVISSFSKKKQPNALSQLEELIKQNYNHASIFCWSIANEISIKSQTKGLEPALEQLNDLAHTLDDTRPTVMAQLSMCPKDSPLNRITDILGYNHYFGWYMQTVAKLDEWLDDFHKINPDLCLCLSEYGAEGITAYHSETPEQGDYTEDYQALYHEHYLKAVSERPWIWGSYIWNMFDFGSAMRNEGGVKGFNNKGMVTADRKIKKDAFYMYKAFWSDRPFVHIAGKRMQERSIGPKTIKVYSNAAEVTLTAGGKTFKKQGEGIFLFEGVDIAEGDNLIVAFTENARDEAVFTGKENPATYKMPEGCSTMVRNWFTVGQEKNPECYSVDDRIGDLLANEQIYSMVRNFAGKKIDNPIVKLFYKVPLRKILSLKIIKVNSDMVDLADGFLQTIKKTEKTK